MGRTRLPRILSGALLLSLTLPSLLPPPAHAARAKSLPRLKISENRRFLVTEKGRPFFYLADTAWELFHRLSREEADQYLRNRAKLGYTAIQAVALAELDGVGTPNAHGDRPLVDRNPARPDLTPGSDPKNDPQYDYWDHVDYIVNRAESLGMYTAMLPSWGRWVNNDKIFTPESARAYGEFLGNRYKNEPIIWVIGGDRNPDQPEQQAVWRALAEGITKGVGGEDKALMTFHPTGGSTSSKWFHNDPWLDFNMWQTGHCADTPVWDRIQSDYNRTPTKPVMDGEPLYEDHPICFQREKFGTSNEHPVRRIAYWDVFAGAHGHTYGNHSIWQMHKKQYGNGVNGPISTWDVAIHRPGGAQMQHLRRLIESRPFLTRIPDQDLLASDARSGMDRIQATRGSDGSYAMIFSGTGQPFTVKMDKISGNQARAHWYDPRTGKATSAGTFPTTGSREFTPPSKGPGNDWVLVLDDARKRFPAPGSKPYGR
ncbi:MAG: glycoside hydrolase family 140 protein [Armatimonadetes bacterium]|nr:glycoside hydrolase family 140 protein [Armatimonadota bacterium]